MEQLQWDVQLPLHAATFNVAQKEAVFAGEYVPLMLPIGSRGVGSLSVDLVYTSALRYRCAMSQ